jgi:hypothetical protein
MQPLTVHTCFTIGAWKWQCCQLYAPVAFTPQEIFWQSFLLETESPPGTQSGHKNKVNEHYNYPIRNQTLALLPCSAPSRTTAVCRLFTLRPLRHECFGEVTQVGFSMYYLTHPTYIYFVSLMSPWTNKERIENHMKFIFCSILYGNWQICTAYHHKHIRKELASDSFKNLKNARMYIEDLRSIYRHWQFQVFLDVMPCRCVHSSWYFKGLTLRIYRHSVHF